MNYLYIKALHIIFVTTWFAGLFYVVRLFIYTIEAADKPDPERTILLAQYNLMSKRLWSIITVPSMWLSLITGIYLVIVLQYYTSGWMHIKFTLVILLLGYHIYCRKIKNDLARNVVKFTSTQMRMWNELATIFLVSIVFIVVLKNMLDTFWGLIVLVMLMAILYIAIKWYKQYRQKQSK